RLDIFQPGIIFYPPKPAVSMIISGFKPFKGFLFFVAESIKLSYKITPMILVLPNEFIQFFICFFFEVKGEINGCESKGFEYFHILFLDFFQCQFRLPNHDIISSYVKVCPLVLWI